MSSAPQSYLTFDPDCRICTRLARLLDSVHVTHPDYHAKPVAAFGDPEPKLLIVGLAPGMHGANRTGRPFTGDFAGILLYQTLHQFGFASAPQSCGRHDGLKLVGCRVTNAVKCLPPQNKPDSGEIRACNRYLGAELRALNSGTAILALGTIAHRAVLAALGLRLAAFPFAHAAQHELDEGRVLFDSYHCSRYNTQTKRLTDTMFASVFAAIVRHIGRPSSPDSFPCSIQLKR
jgi:uracil-DNA glycosylase family 4